MGHMWRPWHGLTENLSNLTCTNQCFFYYSIVSQTRFIDRRSFWDVQLKRRNISEYLPTMQRIFGSVFRWHIFFNFENISFPNIEKWKVFLCVSFQLKTLDFHDTIQILPKVLIPWRFSYFQVVWETDLQKLYCVYRTLLCHSFSHCFLIICEINRTKVKREQHSAAQRRNTKWKNTPLWAHKYPNTRSTLDVMSNIYGIISNIIKISWGFWETINVKKNVSNNHKR